MPPPPPTLVEVHPIVLLSVVDHYNRVAADTRKRVVGVLLGTVNRGKVSVTNSYAVPFEEDERDPRIWFLDHNFHENMYAMYKKVNAREKVVGWYSTGPKIKAADIEINEVLRRYCTHPVYVIIDIKQKELGIPIDAYVAVEEIQDEKSEPKMTFTNLVSTIGAVEAEEIGVEHLLRDVKDTTVSDLAKNVNDRLTALNALKVRLVEIRNYLEDVIAEKLPINYNILYGLQDVFNLLSGLQQDETLQALTTQTNDTMLVMYISSIIRAIIAIHNLINNKRDLKEAEEEAKRKKKAEEEAAKAKEADAAAAAAAAAATAAKKP